VIPEPGQVLHFSEDPGITVFVPHVAATARPPQAFVWAVAADRAPDYWFPRDCPRAMAWLLPTTSTVDRERILGPGGGYRVHAIEYGWLEAIRTVQLFAYRLPADQFVPFGEPAPYAWVATEPVRPLAPPERVANLLTLHEAAGIQLRVLPDLRPFWAAVTKTSLGYSAIRLANAHPGAAGSGAQE
jgi:Family of unknown function (DUF6886)